MCVAEVPPQPYVAMPSPGVDTGVNCYMDPFLEALVALPHPQLHRRRQLDSLQAVWTTRTAGGQVPGVQKSAGDWCEHMVAAANSPFAVHAAQVVGVHGPSWEFFRPATPAAHTVVQVCLLGRTALRCLAWFGLALTKLSLCHSSHWESHC